MLLTVMNTSPSDESGRRADRLTCRHGLGTQAFSPQFRGSRHLSRRIRGWYRERPGREYSRKSGGQHQKITATRRG
ncbi:hypothetical protein ZK99_004327 [Salmonella enterica subsp. enterica]|nr:hypothetical protein [Salmonella enterica subsp. enterica serovar Kottbus]EDJ1505072.1 hypothetical protein [Salmonella enterica]EDM0594522.1 hypothetical protein [Salmonella enterica subsp. enterica serovar Cerro]EDN4396493.1 hypothetical protein [Salmonella enterica subsp. enterica]EDA6905130.1 hypothetical protein [Salmonella enterica subsp. enterica serovar Kottbus]